MGSKNNSINFARVLAWVLFALPILIIYTMSNDPSAKGIGGFAVLGVAFFVAPACWIASAIVYMVGQYLEKKNLSADSTLAQRKDQL